MRSSNGPCCSLTESLAANAADSPAARAGFAPQTWCRMNSGIASEGFVVCVDHPASAVFTVSIRQFGPDREFSTGAPTRHPLGGRASRSTDAKQWNSPLRAFLFDWDKCCFLPFPLIGGSGFFWGEPASPSSEGSARRPPTALPSSPRPLQQDACRHTGADAAWRSPDEVPRLQRSSALSWVDPCKDLAILVPAAYGGATLIPCARPLAVGWPASMLVDRVASAQGSHGRPSAHHGDPTRDPWACGRKRGAGRDAADPAG
jgi:hypothetical protein